MCGEAVELERGAVLRRGSCDAKLPGGGPPPLRTRMSMPPSASRASLHEARRARLGRDVGDERHRAVADLAPPRPRSARASRPQIATCTPSSASAARGRRSPSPCDAAATAARRPAMPRSTATCRRSSTSVNRARTCRAATAAWRPVRRAMISAQIDDRGLLGRAGADVEPDRRHDPGELVVGRRPPRAAARCAWRACGASPSRRGSRRRVASAPTIAGTSNLCRG